MAELLVRHGADIELHEAKQRTALEVAVESGIFPPRQGVNGKYSYASGEVTSFRTWRNQLGTKSSMFFWGTCGSIFSGPIYDSTP